MTVTSKKAAAIGVLRAAYPRQAFPDESVRLYARMLADMGDREVTEAVRALILTSTFLPSISEIRAEVAERRLGLPTAAEAWSLVWHSQRPGIVDEAVRQCGGRWALTHGESHQAERRFVKAYEQLREDAIRTVVVGDSRRQAETAAVPFALNVAARALERIPESDSIEPRPLMKRIIRRYAGLPVGGPTQAEQRDAVAFLATSDDPDDPLQREAENVVWHDGLATILP